MAGINCKCLLRGRWLSWKILRAYNTCSIDFAVNSEIIVWFLVFLITIKCDWALSQRIYLVMLDFTFTSEPRFLFTSSCTSGLRISRLTDDHVTMNKDKRVIHKFKGFQTKSKGARGWRIEFQGIINWTSGKKIGVHVNISFDLRYLSITLRNILTSAEAAQQDFFHAHEWFEYDEFTDKF